MIGLDVIHSQVLSGDQLETMTEPQLDQIISNVSVFYRVTPRHKLSIVKVCTFFKEKCWKITQVDKIFASFCNFIYFFFKSRYKETGL